MKKNDLFKTRVAIHNDFIYGESEFNRRYKEILKLNDIDFCEVNINDDDFWDTIDKVTAFIFRSPHYDNEKLIAKTILPIIEHEMGVACFPNQKSFWHFDDKIRQFFLLKSHNFPVNDSYVFWNREAALNWFENAKLPLVFKLKSGAGSTNVLLIRNRKQGIKLIKKMFGKGIRSNKLPSISSTFVKDFSFIKSLRKYGSRVIRSFFDKNYYTKLWQKEKGYILFQKFLPNNKYDTRITVVGGRAFGYRRFNRKNDFRASGSGKIDYAKEGIDLRCVKIAQEISLKLNFQSMAYDFIYNEKGEPVIIEMCYTYVDKFVYNCPGYWDIEMNWHEGHFWPQYFQLMDLLNIPELKQI